MSMSTVTLLVTILNIEVSPFVVRTLRQVGIIFFLCIIGWIGFSIVDQAKKNKEEKMRGEDPALKKAAQVKAIRNVLNTVDPLVIYDASNIDAYDEKAHSIASGFDECGSPVSIHKLVQATFSKEIEQDPSVFFQEKLERVSRDLWKLKESS